MLTIHEFIHSEPCNIYLGVLISPKCFWKLVDPILMMLLYDFGQDGFQHLVCTFHLSIHLWMVWGGHLMFDLELLSDIPNELG
jgi:hypothetical protein